MTQSITRANPFGHSPVSRCRGMSIVELMIAMAIGSVLLVGISVLILQQNQARTELAKSSRQIENGRYAMQLLHDDIQHAGFWGQYAPPPGTTYLADGDTGLGSCPSPVTAPANLGWVAAVTPTLPVAIFGYPGSDTNATLATAVPCLPSAASAAADRKVGTAVLVVRRVVTDAIAAASALNTVTYLQSSQCESDTPSTPFILSASGSTSFTLLKKNCLSADPATIRRYLTRIYFVSSCNNYGAGQDRCDATADSGAPIPTLKMVEFIDGQQTLVPLVEGIEDLQFDFGLDNAGADGSPDAYSTDPAAADWRNVVVVRVNLLARNTEPTAGYADTKTYTLGGAGTVDPCATNPFSGAASTESETTSCRRYLRHVYSEMTRVENISGRREQP